MADKPSRALVLYGAGHAALLPTPSAARLHSFAASAACGFLSLRSPSPDDAEEKNTTILELAQLLDAYDLRRAKNVEGDGQPTGPTISERFMGLRAAVVTDCPRVSSFAACLGFRVLGAEDLIVQSDASSGQEDADEIRMVARLLGLLGFSGGNVQETYEFDLVFVHVSADKTANKLDWIDKLVGAIMEAAPSGSAIASRVHVSVVLSYGSASESEDQCSLISNWSAETNSDLCLLRPRQSYSLKAGHTLDDVRHHHPMLLAQWQEGVTRIDLAKVFSFDEFVKMQEVVERPIAELSKASEENITSSCERNSIGQNVVTKQDPNFSDQTCISLGGDKKCEENRSPLSRVNKHVSHLDYQMRSSESSSVTHLVSQTYNQVMSLGREYHRQQPFLSPSSYSRQNTSSGLEAVPSNPHTSTGVVGKTRSDTNTRKTKSEYLSAYPTATLNIRSSYPAAVQDDFSLDDNLGQQHRRPDRFTAFSNCNGQPIEQQNELVDSVWEPHGGDDTASLSSQRYFNNESPLLSTEMHYGDEIPSLSGWRCYGTEIPSLSSQLHCAAEIPSLSGLQSYGDEIPSLSSKWSYRNKSPLFSSQCHYGAEVPSLSNHWQGSFHGNGYSKDNIASKFGCSKDSIAGKVGYSKDSIAGKVVSISDRVKVCRNERAFTQPRMASRGVSSSEHYNVSKKSNVWRNPEVIRDQVRGPRADKMNSTSRSCSKRDIMSPLIHRDHFNRSDFSVRYEHAKFFMIKSHCEDDIHKGIKYNVWASTPSGNNKLDAAFHEAQILMKEKGAKCPVFLFFSVNSSGQFAGLAEMLGPVDFKKTMDFWQQDKWNGFFPVMWHIIKDVPNRLFGHITLENNDNRIVTFSRDTQEIPLPQGLEMLEIFKSHPLGTSILDDFDFYEEKESSRRALKGNSQSMYPAKLPDDFKAMEHLEAGIQSLRFYD